MTFPDSSYPTSGDYADEYFSEAAKAAASVDRDKLNEAAGLLTKIYAAGGIVFSCGNGGSAAIANHLVCDHCKLVRTDTDLSSKVVSLSTTIEMITAIANDISYDEIFSYQLRTLASSGDALVTISSSGDSENVVRAAIWAKDNDIPVISMTGFSGGRTSKIADINLHVHAENYGIVEDIHQSLMHILAQYIRQAHMDKHLIKQRKF